jgi:outer membrane receptor protein involved in Fe transport
LNLGTDSRINRFSYRILTEENPWLRSDVLPLNTWNPFRLYGGLRGAFSSKLAFNVQVSYTPQIENQYFFVDDTSAGNWNKLTYVTDNVSLFEVHGEITWQNSEKLKLIARTDYLGYTTDSQEKAWYVPSLRLSLSGKYNLQDKIGLELTLLTRNRQFYREFLTDDLTGVQSPVSKQLKGIADLNIGAEYRYTKRLGMFIRMQNILNVRYKRYLNYPTQRFMLLGGLNYLF